MTKVHSCSFWSFLLTSILPKAIRTFFRWRCYKNFVPLSCSHLSCLKTDIAPVLEPSRQDADCHSHYSMHLPTDFFASFSSTFYEVLASPTVSIQPSSWSQPISTGLPDFGSTLSATDAKVTGHDHATLEVHWTAVPNDGVLSWDMLGWLDWLPTWGIWAQKSRRPGLTRFGKKLLRLKLDKTFKICLLSGKLIETTSKGWGFRWIQ